MKNIITLLAASTLLTVVGCQKKAEETAKPAENAGSLLIWINGDKPYEALQEIGNEFEKATGVKVTVEHPTEMEQKFGQASQAGRGPDIVIWAHDRLGGWAKSGLIVPLNLTEEYKGKFHEKGWSAFTYDNKVWGYPITMEAISLIYNKKLITEDKLPKTLADVAKISVPAGSEKLLWAYDTPYFTWPFLAGEGGYIYKRDAAGTYDIKNVGVNTPGAIAALQTIGDMIKGGTIPRGMTYDVMSAKMVEGKCAMIISGPWEWPNLDKAGIDYGIATIPGMKNTVKPLVGIQGAMISAKSTNKEVAELFIKDYMLTKEGLIKMSTQKFGGPIALKEGFEAQKSDLRVLKSMENVDKGELMPNVPEMGVFWSSIESACKTVSAGQSTAKDALNNAQKIMVTENSK